ncbi:LysR family transcriptional regulator [Bordetella sp. 15P40C-2]|uniref:LysR family transcriptional regulator n=1 Tax=Bordetella sp. 15P40C-2 TaxID=2572246 RepID=UPI001323D6E8|nr:LysR substrate-binding domain-containing protein [Bordetella sp. 15P40C-2]MVW70665.1 LysR family transcriptional regulator [Bordetella sp. 15P40C-2]
MILTRNLTAFIAVAEELHFGKAAKRLHISQPPLSQQIRQFEEEMGVALFERTTRSVRLTPAGRLLLERAHLLQAEADATLQAVRRRSVGDEGLLNLGFSHSTVYHVLPRVLQRFKQVCPRVALELRQLTSDLLAEEVNSRRLDIAILRWSSSMESADLSWKVIASDPMVLVMPLDHPLAVHRRVPIELLHGIPWVGYAPQGARHFYDLQETVLAAAKVQPDIQHVSLLPTLLALVEAGMGAALVPTSVLRETKGRLQKRPLLLPQGCKAPISLLSCAWRTDNMNPVVPRMLKILSAGDF